MLVAVRVLGSQVILNTSHMSRLNRKCPLIDGSVRVKVASQAIPRLF